VSRAPFVVIECYGEIHLEPPLSSLDGGLNWNCRCSGLLISAAKKKKKRDTYKAVLLPPHSSQTPTSHSLPAAVGFDTDIVVCQCWNGCHVLVVESKDYHGGGTSVTLQRTPPLPDTSCNVLMDILRMEMSIRLIGCESSNIQVYSGYLRMKDRKLQRSDHPCPSRISQYYGEVFRK
jgi:hypothetical protein